MDFYGMSCDNKLRISGPENKVKEIAFPQDAS